MTNNQQSTHQKEDYSEQLQYDITTSRWLNDHPDSETTVVRCKCCNKLYKPSLLHHCDTSHHDAFIVKEKSKRKTKMTVAELINKLHEMPQDTIVIVDNNSFCFDSLNMRKQDIWK